MKITNCKHLDFPYETYEGEKRVYCAKCGSVSRKKCRGNCCKDYEKKERK